MNLHTYVRKKQKETLLALRTEFPSWDWTDRLPEGKLSKGNIRIQGLKKGLILSLGGGFLNSFWKLSLCTSKGTASFSAEKQGLLSKVLHQFLAETQIFSQTAVKVSRLCQQNAED